MTGPAWDNSKLWLRRLMVWVSWQAFPEENAAVQLQLVTAAVKLFLKSPQPRAPQMIQLVLTYATQVHCLPAGATAVCKVCTCSLNEASRPPLPERSPVPLATAPQLQYTSHMVMQIPAAARIPQVDVARIAGTCPLQVAQKLLVGHISHDVTACCRRQTTQT